MNSRWDEMEPEIWDGTGTVATKRPPSMVDDEQDDWDEGDDDDDDE